MILPTLGDDEDHAHAHDDDVVVVECVLVAEVVEPFAIAIAAVAPMPWTMRTRGDQLCCFGCHGCWRRRQKVETMEVEGPVPSREVGW